MARRSLRDLTPTGLRRRLSELTGRQQLRDQVAALQTELSARMDRLEQELHESRDETWERSRRRWRGAKPTPNLTWGAEITGDAFVQKAEGYGAFGPERAIVEIGPGYGRLLEAILRRELAFGSYTGVDLSEDNVSHLRQRFGRDGVRFQVGDAETVSLDQQVDTVISSLTFKHLFPSFERALANLARGMAPGGVAVFDLIEGRRRYFEDDGVTYIRWYERGEVEAILAGAGLECEAFDEVRHHPDVTRLLVVARRPG